MMPGYFDKEHLAENRRLYPNIAALDEKVATLLKSSEARGWDTARREYEICHVHPIYWMENYGYVRSASLEGGAEEVAIVPFQLNTTQLQVANKIVKAFVPTPWLRVQAVVLKYRKAGISTLLSGFNYWLMRFTRNFSTFTIADLSSHTDNLTSMVMLFHERDRCGMELDSLFHPPRKIPMPGRNKKGLHLSNGSLLEQDTGENSNPGTSGTIQGCHMSENAKWRDAKNAETSLINSIPRKGFAFVVKESTAFGSNKFAQDCELAERGQSNWEFIFVSWRDLPECESPLEMSEALEPTVEEQELVAAYKLRPGHLKFRRSKIEDLGSLDLFKQDFPLNSRECFMTGGMNYFPVEKVQDRIDEIHFFRDWKLRGWDAASQDHRERVIRLENHPRGLRESLALMEDRNVIEQMCYLSSSGDTVTATFAKNAKAESGAVSIFRPPERGRVYLVTIDVAEGIRTSEYTSDLSVIEVFDTLRREQVAEWAGVFDEEVTANFAVLLAQYYNFCDIAPEMNNRCGGLLWENLIRLKYPRLFKRQRVVGNMRKEEPGWLTTAGTKQDIVGLFKQLYKNDDCLIHSLPLLDEMLTYSDVGGKLCASSGHTDDRVSATSVAMQLIEVTPAYRRSPEQRRRKEHGVAAFNPMPRPPNRNIQSEVLRRYM